MLLAFGIVSAVLEARSSGRGQVVDAAMVDGSALLLTMVYEARNLGLWTLERGTNLLDGGAPFYDVYATSDGGTMAVGCLEPAFYAELLRVLDLDRPELRDHTDTARWPDIRAALTEAFASRTRAEWEEAFTGSDACVAPVLDLDEARSHPHGRARQAFYESDAGPVPMPAPRFDRTPTAVPGPASRKGADTRTALADWGFAAEEIEALCDGGRGVRDRRRLTRATGSRGADRCRSDRGRQRTVGEALARVRVEVVEPARVEREAEPLARPHDDGLGDLRREQRPPVGGEERRPLALVGRSTHGRDVDGRRLDREDDVRRGAELLDDGDLHLDRRPRRVGERGRFEVLWAEPEDQRSPFARPRRPRVRRRAGRGSRRTRSRRR